MHGEPARLGYRVEVKTVERHAKPRVLEALGDTRIVVVQGARQVGKTTLIRDVTAEREGRLVTLDDDLTRVAAHR